MADDTGSTNGKGRSTPPNLWEWLLRGALPRGAVGDSIVGDLREQFVRRASADSVAAARWYAREVRSVLLHNARARLLGRWATEPRLWSSGVAGEGKARGDPMYERLLRGVSFALRSLVRTPRYSLIAVFTLALGIGANAATFSVVNGVLLQPLDHPDSDELVNVFGSAPGIGYNRMSTSAHYYFLYRGESTAFAEMGMYHRVPCSITGDGDPENVSAVAVTHTLFPTLRVEASLGRAFTSDEDLPDGPAVALISDGLWRRRYGSEQDIVGRTITINGNLHEIVGVMPPAFDFPADIDVWLPGKLDPENAPWNFTYPTVARLAPGVSAARAQAQLGPIHERIVAIYYPEGSDWRALMVNGQYAPQVRSLKEDLVGSLERPLWILLGTVGFVLLIACTNVANLVLIRGENRQRELAVRAALGASSAALARQSLAESICLAVGGAVLGLLVAWVGVPAVLSYAPPQLPRIDEVRVDGVVLLFTLCIMVLSVLLFGIAPILRSSPFNLLSALKQSGPGNTPGPWRRRSRAFLVIAQTAVALVLMVGSGLLVRSFWKIYRTELGFQYENLLTFRVSLPESRYPSASEITAYHENLLQRLRTLPGVETAGMTSVMPVADGVPATTFVVMGAPAAENEPLPLLDHKYVSSGFVETIGIPLISGETFLPIDNHGQTAQVMIDELFAERFWPGENPVGRQLRFARQPDRWYSVSGVVGATRELGARQDPKPLIYLPLMSVDGDSGWSVASATFVVRSHNTSAVAQSIHEAIWEVDPEIPIAGMRNGTEIVAESIVRLSFTMVTLGIAATLALILGTVGLYGVLSYSVTQRRKEIAVQIAVGARQSKVMQNVVLDGAKITGAGILVGLVASWGLTRILGSILFGVEAVDPATYFIMALLLLLVAVLASYLPARRAALVDPLEAMKAE